MGFAAGAAWALIHLYRLTLSRMLGARCRFYPSCSVYGQTALHTHGFLRGMALILLRLGRCHPWHPGGFDEVPSRPAGNPASGRH